MNVSVLSVTQNGNQVTVTGSASAGAEVDLLQDGTIIGSTTANNVDGSFSITATVNGDLDLNVSSGGRTTNVEVPIPPPGG
jgi:outer membrane usher protein FimD/PapC